MNFELLCKMIFDLCRKKAGNQLPDKEIESKIFALSKDEVCSLIIDASSIPESIPHDSSEEKLFTKMIEILLAKSFQELGLKAETIKKRSGCADVIAKSVFHHYTLVADAKAFRLSRTAKNQKDFKVEAMDQWRKDNDYAVLVCPYFQYPKQTSQIFEQAITRNVLLFSWEHLYFMMANNILETEKLNLSSIWNQSKLLASSITADKLQNNFIDTQNVNILKLLKLPDSKFASTLLESKRVMVNRSSREIDYWNNKLLEIRKYSRTKAIEELVAALKINEKIKAIQAYSDSLNEDCDGIK